MEYRGPSSSNSTRPQGSRAPFSSIMMHHGPPPFNVFQNSISRPTSPPVPTFNFNGNIVEGIRNPTLRYRTRVPKLSDKQQVLLDNFWNIQIKQPSMRLGHEKLIRALEQEFDNFNFNFHQSQHHIHSLEHNLQVISRDHESLLSKFTKMNQELQTLRMQQKASDTLKRELKIGLETDQHKNKEKEVIEPIEQDANEPIEDIKIELLEDDIEMEQHQNNEQHQHLSDKEKQERYESFLRNISLDLILDDILLEEISKAKLRVMPPDMQNEILNRASQSMKELQLQLQCALYQSIFDPKPGMDIITKMYPPCLCDSTESCSCKPEVSIAVARINMRDYKPWHFSYEHKEKHNVVEITPALLLEFGYLDKIFINHVSQLELFPEKLLKVAEDYLERWKEICISFISSPPDWYVHMHKEKARHIAMINEESFKLSPISSHKWTPSYKNILKFRGIQMLALDEFEDFRYDMVLVAEEEEMYIYSKTRISHQPYWKPQNFKEETAEMYYKVKEERERDAELVEGDEQYWNNLSEEELHNIDNMMEA